MKTKALRFVHFVRKMLLAFANFSRQFYKLHNKVQPVKQLFGFSGKKREPCTVHSSLFSDNYFTIFDSESRMISA